ncbi:MAG: PorP/SprF family type IX secretion system membrane protein [Candidatus Aureabacteria bacterium]|nr:PorP/SprF family type IX secretion system membrane protein [Candidatus Auribacterota bacterium]
MRKGFQLKLLYKYFIIIIFLIVTKQFSVAQTVYQGNLYPYFKYTLNSAYAGADGYKSLFLDYRNASNSIQGSPTQMMFAYNMPVFNNMGLGVRLENHTEGLFGFFTGLVDYSYFVKLNNNQYLRFGISGGISNSQLDNSKIVASDPSAIVEIASKYFLGTTFESTVGIVYQWDNLSFELSAPRLFGTGKVFKPNFSSSLSYNFYTLDNQLVLQAGVLLFYKPSTPLVYDINLTAEIKQNFMIGIGYRNRPGLVLSAGLLFDEIKVFYAAELGIGNYSNIFNTIHEISVGYTFGKVKKMPTDSLCYPPLDLIVKTDSLSSDSITDISNKEIITDVDKQDSITDISNQEIITDIDTQDSLTDISNQEVITDKNLDLTQDSVVHVEKDSVSTQQKKPKFEIIEVGDGVYELKPLDRNADPINESMVDSILEIEQFDEKEDVNDNFYKDSQKTHDNLGDFEIIEIGSGIYSIKENEKNKNI